MKWDGGRGIGMAWAMKVETQVIGLFWLGDRTVDVRSWLGGKWVLVSMKVGFRGVCSS